MVELETRSPTRSAGQGPHGARASHVRRPAPAPGRAPRPVSSGETHPLLRWLLRIGALTLAAVLLIAMFAGGVYVKLRHSPISLNFAARAIEGGVAAELPGLGVKIGNAVLALDDTGSMEIRLLDIRISETDGDVVATVPHATASLSTKAMRDFRLVPERLSFIEPRLIVSHSDSGGFSLAVSPVPTPQRAKPQADAAGATAPDVGTVPPSEPQGDLSPLLKRIDLARVISEATGRARKRIDASYYLREFGVRNATVVVESAGRRSYWLLNEGVVDLDHRRGRSVISGNFRVASKAGPWSLSFSTHGADNSNTLSLTASVRDLVPRALADGLPQFAVLKNLDVPLAGNASLELSPEGELSGGAIAIEIGRGNIATPGMGHAAFGIDGGLLTIDYDAKAERFVLQPSALRWGQSRMTVAGEMKAGNIQNGPRAWRYRFTGTDVAFAAEEFGVAARPVDVLEAEGEVVPSLSQLRLSRLVMKAGAAEAHVDGVLSTRDGIDNARFNGRMSPMPLETVKAWWPRALSPRARRWIGENVARANVAGGTLTFLSGEHLKREQPSAAPGEERVLVTVEAHEVAARPLKQLPPVEAARVLVRVENKSLEVSIPDPSIALDKGRRVPLKGARLTVADVDVPRPMAELTMRSLGPLGPHLEVLAADPNGIVRQLGIATEGIEGKVDGQYKLTMPLIAELQPEEIRIEGKVRVTDGRMKGAAGGHDVQGAAINLDFNEKAVDASGELIVAGVLAKLNWQRIFDAPADKQPPLRITASLDNSDRTQLGMDINQIVQGEVPVEVTVGRGMRDELAVHVRAELTNAELMIEPLGWRKPPGRAAVLQFDVAKGRTHKTELQNFKVAGDDIAIEGWVGLGAENKLKEFYFPDFSLNVVTRLEVQGTVANDGVLAIKAKGPTWDGRDFFRSLFAFGQADKSGKAKKPRTGLDIDVDIDTVIGFSDVSLKALKVKYASRQEKMTGFDAKGTLDGGKPLVLSFRQEPGQPRRLLADTTDAGQAFRLVGFYPNVQGGRARLEVNVDGKGPAEKTGTLWVEDFRILGDPVVSEVLSSSDPTAPVIANGKRQRVVRQAIDFDRMRVPFSVGHNQFVLEDAYLRGPILGATIRGKADYKLQTVSLGGTYIPLQGLNNVLGEVPLLGQLLSGPRGEGIFGITFAIQGPIANPQVIVNPLSLVAPGIFREMFQMTNPDPRIQARDEKRTPAESGVRASSTSSAPVNGKGTQQKLEPATAPAASAARTKAQTIDGWSSETVVSPKKK